MIPISSSDEYSWKRSSELLVEVARHGEESGHEVPSLIVAAKDALDPHPMSVQNSVRVYFLSLKSHLLHTQFLKFDTANKILYLRAHIAYPFYHF
jgi:Ras family protein T1